MGNLYTRKEFAALCHTTTAVITTNINRNKIILFDKKIDSGNAINKSFFNKYSKKAEKAIKEGNKPKAKSPQAEKLYGDLVHTISREEVISKAAEKRRKKANDEADEVVSWEQRKKIADALLQERKAEQAQLQLEKMAGKLIPTDLVFDIIRVHNQSIFATFQNDAENLASIYCDILAAGDRKMLAEINDKLGDVISISIKRSEDVALAGITNAIEEYSKTRNRGERK